MLPHHHLGGGAGEQEDAPQVGGDHLIPVVVAHDRQERVLGDAGVVDDDVEPLVRRHDGVDGGLGAGRVGHVAGVDRRHAAGGLDLVGNGLQLFDVPGEARDLGAGTPERERDRPANAARGAGHQRDLAGEIDLNAAIGCVSHGWSFGPAMPSPDLCRCYAAMFSQGKRRSMRFSRPASTRPGPIS